MMSTPNALMSVVMILAGVGIPIMAALNGGLGTRLGNPVQAAVVLFSLALMVSTIVLFLQPKPITLAITQVPKPFLTGGFFVAFYVLSITFIAPRVGVGNAIVLVLLGQMCASAAIDHFGWLGAPSAPLSLGRGAGLIMMAFGVMLVRKPVDF